MRVLPRHAFHVIEVLVGIGQQDVVVTDLVGFDVVKLLTFIGTNEEPLLVN